MSVLFVHNDLDKNTLKLQHPKGIKGGAYTSVIAHNEGDFYLQLPKCMLRNGIVKTDKKIYCDLLFDKYDEQVVSWFENLQAIIQELIYEKKNVWFNGEIEKDDIEDTFINMIKTYRSGKNYLVRCYLPKDITTVTCYNEEQESVELDSIVGEETLLIPLVEIANLRFTSRNFQVDLVLRELMIVEDDDSDDETGDETDDETDNDTDAENSVDEKTEPASGEKEEEKEEQEKEEKEEEENEPTSEENIDDSSIQLNIEDISDTNIELTKNNIKENLVESKKEESITQEASEVKNEAENVAEVKAENVAEVQAENVAEVKAENVAEVKAENVAQVQAQTEAKTDAAELQEVTLNLETLETSKPISLKSPQNVYYAIWQNAKQRLKFHRAEALKAFLEAKNIKNTYLVNEIDNDSEDEFKLEQ